MMRSPRDVARLHTQLAITSAELLGEVNVADIVLAEALRLKVPAFLPWMRLNHAHVIAAGVARYDSTLDSRGFYHGDVETTWNTEQERDDRRDVLMAELRALAGADSLARAPYERALEFVFDDLRRFASVDDKRSSASVSGTAGNAFVTIRSR